MAMATLSTMTESDSNTISESNTGDLASTDELLVAYLDGELDAERCQEVETKLAQEDDFRRRLNALEKAWDLLDELPSTVADEKFVRSTVEMVALEARQEAETLRERSAWPRRISTLAVGAMVLCAAFLGYRAVDQYSGAADDALARDLPVIEDLDLYRRFDDMDFLRRLHEEGLFEEETRDAS